MADQERPSKRIKTGPSAIGSSDAPIKGDAAAHAKSGQRSESSAHNDGTRPSQTQSTNSRKKGYKANSTQVKKKAAHNPTRTFAQPSVLCAGDKGIFVTSDKGCEKKALLDLHDITQEYLEARGIDAYGQPASKIVETEATTTDDTEPRLGNVAGIEADIASELAGLRSDGQTDTNAAPSKAARPIQLITLDIPCVSFLRLPPKSQLDPVELVHRICSEAAEPENQQRSRFVKRLTPVSSLAKALSQGIERISEDVLSTHFGPDSTGIVTSIKYAIRPSIRENEQLNRDSIIKVVADCVQKLGANAHKVDLKNYEKGVLVEVYRGWVGMCVVNNLDTGPYKQGYEELKRFNLAEVYAKR